MTEDNFVDFKCPYCEETVSFPVAMPSSLQECPSCGQSLLLPVPGGAEGRPIPLPLAAPGLVLRRFGPGDWKDLLEIYGAEENFQFIEGYPLDEEAILRWLEEDGHVRLTTPNHNLHLAIQDQGTEKVIGVAGIALAESRRQARLTLMVHRQFQRQGVGAKALAVILEFLLGDLSLHRVHASCDTRNVGACRVLEKAGLRREGEFRQDSWVREEWVSTAWYAILGEEYRAAAPPVTKV